MDKVGRSAEADGLSCSASSPQAVSPVPASIPSALFIPRCKISTRYEKGVALLLDHGSTKRGDAVSWGTANWGRLLPFGAYYEGVEEIDLSDPAPFPFIEADMLGVGRLAFIGGPRWEEAFPEYASAIEARRAETETGSVHESAGPQGGRPDPTPSILSQEKQ